MFEIIISAFAGTLAYFTIGWIVFEGLLGKYMTENTTKIVGFKKSEKDSSLFLIAFSCAAYALLLAIIFSEWTYTSNFSDGFVLGSLIGGLIAVMTNTYWYATSNFFNNLKPIFADVIAAIFTVGFMGGVIGWVFGFI